MIGVIICERGYHIDGKQIEDVMRHRQREAPVLDYIRLEEKSLPKDLGIGNWLLLLGVLFTVSKCVYLPVETGGISDYDVCYLAWPLLEEGIDNADKED